LVSPPPTSFAKPASTAQFSKPAIVPGAAPGPSATAQRLISQTEPALLAPGRAAILTPAPPASPPSTQTSLATVRSSTFLSKSRSTPPAPPSCSLPPSMAANPCSSVRSFTTPAAISPNCSQRPSTGTPSTTSSPKRTSLTSATSSKTSATSTATASTPAPCAPALSL